MSRFRMFSRAYRQQLAAQDAEKITRIVGENEENQKNYANTPAGDKRKLRGIPVAGFGGVISGTHPLGELMAKQPHDNDY